MSEVKLVKDELVARRLDQYVATLVALPHEFLQASLTQTDFNESALVLSVLFVCKREFQSSQLHSRIDARSECCHR
jgi:hypothetical protein